MTKRSLSLSRRAAYRCALALAIGCSLAAPSRAQGPRSESAADTDVERAEAYAAQAFDAYGRRDYAAAVAFYRKAYAASPTADILFNIARIYDFSLPDRPLAISFYREYVAHPEAQAERVTIALDRLAQLQANEQAALSPPAPTTAPASPARDNAVERAGAEPDGQRRELEPAAPLAAARSSSEASKSEGDWTPLRVGAIVAGTVGLVGIGIGSGFGVAALSDASTAREYCDGDVCTSRRGVDAAHSASKSADIATVSFALGGSLLATGVALLWLSADDAPSEDGVAAVSWTPVATDSQLGVALSGAW